MEALSVNLNCISLLPSTEEQQRQEELIERKSLSVYQKGDLTPETMAKCAMRLMKAFPEITRDWLDLLLERAKENGFSDQRLTDAVNHCIDTYVYGRLPNIANIIGFDKRIDFVTATELDKQWKYDPNIFAKHELIVKNWYVKKELAAAARRLFEHE